MRAGAVGWSGPAGRQEARPLGWACLFVGAVSLWTAMVPFSPTAPTQLAAALGVLALALGTGLLAAGGRAPQVVLHGVLAAATVGVTVCIAVSTTPAGRVVTSYGYVWVAVYAAWYHPRWVAAVHVAGIGAGFALGLWISDAPSPVQTWVFVMATVTGVAAALHVLVTRLRGLAERDQLTGLLTRSAFASAAERYMTLARRYGKPLTLALIDLNDFKLVNDRRGHAAGDELLAEMAQAWSGVLRRGDVLGRHGGDEFVLLMPRTTEAQSTAVLRRLRDASGAGLWTAGVAEWGGEPLPEWMARADVDLYANKAHGGRRG